VVNVKNPKAGKLTATKQLVMSGAKRFALDSITATRPMYLQLVNDNSGARTFTLLNMYDQSIYFYDYDTERFLKKRMFAREGPNGILGLAAYCLYAPDIYYMYSMQVEFVATDSVGRVKQHIAMHGDDREWVLTVPQYLPNSSAPMTAIDNHVVLVGMSSRSLTSKDIEKQQRVDNFRHTMVLDTQTNSVSFHHLYPKELYADANWEGGRWTEPFFTLAPSGQMVFSYPVSHDLYLADYNSDGYTTVYGGSNEAQTISSMDYENVLHTPNEYILAHDVATDIYQGIHYDPFRHVYYRFMLKRIPGARSGTSSAKKPIVVIMMDEQFNYLGETTIGTGEEWNCANAFVTEEGLNIEYIDKTDVEEYFLNFKIFTPAELE
jgi:hypothetical protein